MLGIRSPSLEVKVERHCEGGMSWDKEPQSNTVKPVGEEER